MPAQVLAVGGRVLESARSLSQDLIRVISCKLVSYVSMTCSGSSRDFMDFGRSPCGGGRMSLSSQSANQFRRTIVTATILGNLVIFARIATSSQPAFSQSRPSNARATIAKDGADQDDHSYLPLSMRSLTKPPMAAVQLDAAAKDNRAGIQGSSKKPRAAHRRMRRQRRVYAWASRGWGPFDDKSGAVRRWRTILLRKEKDRRSAYSGIGYQAV